MNDELQKLERIETQLKKALDLSKKQVTLLDKIRQRDNKLATPEELELLEKYNGMPLSDGIIALILEYKAVKKASKQTAYNPFLLREDPLTRLTLNYKVAELIAKKEPFHYDCIVKTGPHCSPIQLDYDGQQLRIFYIEASVDKRNNEFAKSFEPYAEFSGIYTHGNIQFDSTSCSIFSMQHLNNLSSMSFEAKKTLFDGEEQQNHLLLAPIFLKNIQSVSRLDEYNINHKNEYVDKKKEHTLEEHIAQYSITVDTSEAVDGSKLKTRNYAISYKKYKYLQAALALFKKLESNEPPEHLYAIIQNRFNTSSKNLFSNEIEEPSSLQNRMLAFFIKQNDIKSLHLIVEQAISSQSAQIIDDLINLGAGFNQIAPPQRPPISWAIRKGYVELARELLLIAPDKNIDSKGNPYIQIITDWGRLPPRANEMLDLMIELKVDLSAKDSRGQTVLHLISTIQTEEGYQLFKQLILLGLNVNEKNHNGETPLAYFLKYSYAQNQDQSIKLLLKAGADHSSLPSTYLTKDKMRDYFNESIKENDISSFQHLLALQKKSAISLSNDELLLMIAKNFATKKFAKFVLDHPENITKVSVQERFKFLKTTQEINAEINEKIESILTQRLEHPDENPQRLLTNQYIENLRKDIILNGDYRFKTTLIHSGISNEAIKSIIQNVLDSQSDDANSKFKK